MPSYIKGDGLVQRNFTLAFIVRDVICSDFYYRAFNRYIKTPDYSGAIGDVITIKARDDFKVVRVAVKIVSALGKIIEKGDATRLLRKPNIWKYNATAFNSTVKGTVIKIRAYDIPDNEGQGEITLN